MNKKISTPIAIIIILILAVAVGASIYLESNKRTIHFPEIKILENKINETVNCESDSDCVGSVCCHPDSCINKAYRGVCNMLCTQSCEGPLDCGKGICACVNNKCIIKQTSIDETANLEFSTGECDVEINPYSEPVSDILSQKWLDNNTLFVEAYLKTYCGGAEITGSYEIKDNELILKYNVKIKGPVTACVCTHGLTYKISNLEKKDYQISLIEEE